MHESERSDTVRRIARAGDPDRSLAALFAPRETRNNLFALYAFNVELARIAEQVSEPDLGAIRLLWWREALERSAKGWITGNPVADAFGALVRRRGLSASHVAALVDARNFDIAERIMLDWAALEAYLRDTAAGLFFLAAKIVGSQGKTLEPASQSAGLAYGLVGLMRALPIHTAQGRVYLPADALVRHGTSPEDILAGKTSEGLLRLLAELREKARKALDEAKAPIAELDASGRRVFLPLCLVDPYLAALEKSGRDPLREIADIKPLYRLWRMATRWR